MSNAVLPSDESSKQRQQELPSGLPPGESASLPGGEQQLTPEPKGTQSLSTLRERLAEATSRGGLRTLPAGFDDADGDWQTVLSDDVFERLYLDRRQWQNITPEMVVRHADLLTEFWKQKHAVLSQGAAKLLIVRKFGGNELKIRTYPAEIQAACEALRAPERIVAAGEKARQVRIKVGREKLDESIRLALADGQFVDVEARVFLARAAAVDLSEQEVREFLLERLQAKRLRPIVNGQPSGTVPEDLFSVTWESLKEPPQAAPGPEVTRPRDDSAPQPVAGSPRPSAAGPPLESSGPGQADASVTGPGPVQDTAGHGVSPPSTPAQEQSGAAALIAQTAAPPALLPSTPVPEQPVGAAQPAAPAVAASPSGPPPDAPPGAPTSPEPTG
jgi:hypothetical protein